MVVVANTKTISKFLLASLLSLTSLMKIDDIIYNGTSTVEIMSIVYPENTLEYCRFQ